MKALPVEPSNVPVAIGSRIRAARQSQRLTIEQVADATGLTKGFLSRVERDLTSPSVASLVTLCQVLSISIGDLFAAPETHLTKRDDGPRISLGGEGIVERLLTARSERRVQIIQAVIEPRGRGESELYAVDCDVDVLHDPIARHAKMHVQRRAIVEHGELVLAAPVDARDGPADESPQSRPAKAATHVRMRHGRAGDPRA